MHSCFWSGEVPQFPLAVLAVMLGSGRGPCFWCGEAPLIHVVLGDHTEGGGGGPCYMCVPGEDACSHARQTCVGISQHESVHRWPGLVWGLQGWNREWFTVAKDLSDVSLANAGIEEGKQWSSVRAQRSHPAASRAP